MAQPPDRVKTKRVPAHKAHKLNHLLTMDSAEGRFPAIVQKSPSLTFISFGNQPLSDDSHMTGDPTHDGGGKLLHMVDFDATHPVRVMAELRDYWQGLRKGQAVPLRSDVEPQGIRKALDYTFILERIAPGAARFRLAGRHLIDLMGMEVRGMPLCSFLNPGSRGRLSDVLETVFKVPQIAELHLEARGEYGRPPIVGRMLLLPLRSDLGDITRALGCLIADGEIGTAPRRFDLAHERITPVIAGAEVVEPSPSARGFSEPSGDWSPKSKTRRGKPAPIMAPTPVASAAGDDSTGRIDTPSAAEMVSPEARRARFRLVVCND